MWSPAINDKPPRQPLDRRLVVILLIVFVQLFGASLVLPILPLYATNRFQMSYESVTLLNTAFFAAQFVAGPFIGRLSDHYGRLPVLIVSQIGTVVSFIMLGLAQNVEMLFLARILDGITGGNIIVAQAYVTDITPREKRMQALGYILAAFGSGFIFGPAIGGLLATAFGYEMPYFFAAAAAAAVVLLTWRVLDETLTPEQRAANRVRGGQDRMSVGSVLGNLPLLAILAMAFGSQFAFAMLQSTFSLFGDLVLFAGYPEGAAELGIGLLMAMIGVGQIFTQLVLIRRLAGRYSEGMLVVIGTLLRSLVMFSLVLVQTPYPAAISLFFYAMGTGIQNPAMQSLITSTVPDSQRGGALGLYQSAFSLSIIIGSALAGTLFAFAPVLPFLLGGLLFALMSLPGLFLARWSRRVAAVPLKPSLHGVPGPGTD